VPPVIVLEGSGSRGLACAGAPAAEELDIRLIAPDRAARGTLVDGADAVAALTDALALQASAGGGCLSNSLRGGWCRDRAGVCARGSHVVPGQGRAAVRPQRR
jgi:hypothetical protein